MPFDVDGFIQPHKIADNRRAAAAELVSPSANQEYQTYAAFAEIYRRAGYTKLAYHYHCKNKLEHLRH